MDFETIKNNAINAFRQLTVLRVIVTSPNEKVADVPALYALVSLLLAPWVCAAVLVLGFLDTVAPLDGLQSVEQSLRVSRCSQAPLLHLLLDYRITDGND